MSVSEIELLKASFRFNFRELRKAEKVIIANSENNKKETWIDLLERFETVKSLQYQINDLLLREKAVTKKELKSFLTKVEELIDLIGRNLAAFD